jgi:hypothetical protein
VDGEVQLLLLWSWYFWLHNEESKGKFHLRTGHVGQEEEQRYGYTLSLTSALDVMGGQGHALAVLPPENRRYSLYRRLGEPQGRSRRVRKYRPPTGIRSPDRPPRSESLYRLSYPGPHQQGINRSYVVINCWKQNYELWPLKSQLRRHSSELYYPHDDANCMLL